MSDQPDRFAQILAEITGLRGDLVGVKTELRDELVGVRSGLRAELVGVRTDLMGRMDRLQDSLTAIRDDIGVNMAGRMQPSA